MSRDFQHIYRGVLKNWPERRREFLTLYSSNFVRAELYMLVVRPFNGPTDDIGRMIQIALSEDLRGMP